MKQSWLSWFLRGILLVGFFILLSRMFELGIIKGAYYRNLSEENRIRHIPLPAPRGRILARGGEILADNVETKKRIKFSAGSGYELTDDLKDASPEDVVSVYVRRYPLGTKFGHGSGYITEANSGEVGKINPGCPEKGPVLSGSLIGKTGLEEEYECLLRGVPGEELTEVDTSGGRIRTLGRKEPIGGADVKTNIDFSLQSEVADDMEGLPGAAIVTGIKGEVLAIYSSPSFDPNLFVGERDNQEISDLLVDGSLPFFNRAIGGLFHPGSVFKPVVAIAALESGVINRDFRFDDPGVITINEFSYTNWFFTGFGRKEGTIDLVRAIARSTDTFFYRIGELAGPENIARWADKLGADRLTGIDLPSEKAGLIPTPDWKKRVKKESWFLGNTYHMAIGQGDVAITPIEVNTYISAVASGGSLCKPRLFGLKESCTDVGIEKENLDLVAEGMRQACSEGGTAVTFFDFAVKHGGTEIACKTGTAEVGTDGTPHAWFTLFVPFDNPQVVATVLIERGGEGSKIAGPIARKIMDFYFQGNQTSQ
jgi:penicillin-binding protein 2